MGRTRWECQEVNRFRTQRGKTTRERYTLLEGHRYDCQPMGAAEVNESLITDVGSGKEAFTRGARWYRSVRGVPCKAIKV